MTTALTAPASLQLVVDPLSPLVLRSGRPFGATGQTGAIGASMPLPGTMAGTLRAAWCDATGHAPFDQDSHIDRLHLHGPLLLTWHVATPATPQRAQLWLPAPCNARGRSAGAVALRPASPPAHSGCDLPFGMLPVLPPNGPGQRLVDPPAGFWSLKAVVDWLCSTSPILPSAPWQAYGQWLAPPRCEEQVHIRTDASRQVEDGAFFINLACDYTLPDADARRHGQRGLWVRCDVPQTTPRQQNSRHAHPPADQLLKGFRQAAGRAWRLGADGSLAQVSCLEQPDPVGQDDLVRLDATLKDLKPGDGLCLMLATPGCFGSNGWFPWLRRDETAPCLNGKRQPLPSLPAPEGRLLGWPPGWRFRLRAARVGPAIPQGSLKLRSDRAARPLAQTRQPQATQRQAPQPQAASGLGRLQWLVPGGSMYWFEVLQAGDPPAPGSLQLRPCSEVQFARDGHALALYARVAALPHPAPAQGV